MKPLNLVFLLLLIAAPIRAEIIAIADIHGPTSISPYLDRSVTTEGIVTLVHANSFWIQTPSDRVPVNRDGIQVFTADPAPVGVGDRVRVTGYVDHYRRPDRERDRYVTRLIQPHRRVPSKLTAMARSTGTASAAMARSTSNTSLGRNDLIKCCDAL